MQPAVPVADAGSDLIRGTWGKWPSTLDCSSDAQVLGHTFVVSQGWIEAVVEAPQHVATGASQVGSFVIGLGGKLLQGRNPCAELVAVLIPPRRSGHQRRCWQRQSFLAGVSARARPRSKAVCAIRVPNPVAGSPLLPQLQLARLSDQSCNTSHKLGAGLTGTAVRRSAAVAKPRTPELVGSGHWPAGGERSIFRRAVRFSSSSSERSALRNSTSSS